MDYKIKIIKYKKAFGLYLSILLMFIFSSLSMLIMSTKTMSTNIDMYKYHHLQCKIHLDYIKDYILKYSVAPNWNNANELYYATIISSDDNKTFDIFISPKNDLNIRLHKQIELL